MTASHQKWIAQVKQATTRRFEAMAGSDSSTPVPLAGAGDRLAVQRAAAEAVRALDAVTLAAQRALHSAQRLEEALQALDAIDRGGNVPGGSLASPPRHLNRAGPPLTSREEEVLALVAAGCSNKEIADALYVSPNTVKTHVASLLTKLRADSRVQLAAIATQHGQPGHAARSSRSARTYLSPA